MYRDGHSLIREEDGYAIHRGADPIHLPARAPDFPYLVALEFVEDVFANRNLSPAGNECKFLILR